MRTILFTTCFLAAIVSNAQSNHFQKSNCDSLYYKNHIFRLYPTVICNGQQLVKKDAIAVFSTVPNACEFYKKYRRQYAIGLYSLAGMFTGLFILNAGFEQGNRSLQAAGMTVAVTCFYNGIVFLILGDAKLRKAIKIYNSSVLK